MTGRRPPILRPPGEEKTLWRSTLQTGSKLRQDMSPLCGFDVHLAGLCCAKAGSDMRMETRRCCRQVGVDDDEVEADLIAVEPIVF